MFHPPLLSPHPSPHLSRLVACEGQKVAKATLVPRDVPQHLPSQVESMGKKCWNVPPSVPLIFPAPNPAEPATAHEHPSCEEAPAPPSKLESYCDADVALQSSAVLHASAGTQFHEAAPHLQTPRTCRLSTSTPSAHPSDVPTMSSDTLYTALHHRVYVSPFVSLYVTHYTTLCSQWALFAASLKLAVSGTWHAASAARAAHEEESLKSFAANWGRAPASVPGLQALPRLEPQRICSQFATRRGPTRASSDVDVAALAGFCRLLQAFAWLPAGHSSSCIKGTRTPASRHVSSRLRPQLEGNRSRM